MSTSTKETAKVPTPASGGRLKPTKKARAGARRAHVASTKGKLAKRTTPAKQLPRGAKKAKGVETVARARGGSKTASILELLKRPGGATSKELMEATGWQPHSVRGFLSGTVNKKMGLAITSAKGEDGERIYSVKA